MYNPYQMQQGFGQPQEFLRSQMPQQLQQFTVRHIRTTLVLVGAPAPPLLHTIFRRTRSHTNPRDLAIRLPANLEPPLCESCRLHANSSCLPRRHGLDQCLCLGKCVWESICVCVCVCLPHAHNVEWAVRGQEPFRGESCTGWKMSAAAAAHTHTHTHTPTHRVYPDQSAGAVAIGTRCCTVRWLRGKGRVVMMQYGPLHGKLGWLIAIHLLYHRQVLDVQVLLLAVYFFPAPRVNEFS